MPLQATSGAASYDGFGGGVVAEPNYIESCFSTYLYTGNGSTQTITNGIDLSTKGGLVWCKDRTIAGDNALYDTARGVQRELSSNNTASSGLNTGGVTAFNTTGFTVGADGNVNANGYPIVSWTFRKQPKFFDVVTYTGNGTSGRAISHNLQSIPGAIFIKRTDTTSNWIVMTNQLSYALWLNSTNADTSTNTDNGYLTDTGTSTTFSVYTGSSGISAVNASGGTYVAYLFAHNAGGFGLTGTDNVISCGSYTGTGAAGNTVNLGYEPQWLMVKNASAAEGDGWVMLDVMRGMPNYFATDQSRYLSANSSSAEQALNLICPTATGFYIDRAGNPLNTNAQTYIYIAIRRGPMAVPTDGTSVFSPISATPTSGPKTTFTTNFPTDLIIERNISNSDSPYFVDRLRGGQSLLNSSATDAESSSSPDFAAKFDSNTNVISQIYNTGYGNIIGWNFRRAPSFFDEVCYTGVDSGDLTLNHNLSVPYEMLVIKRRSGVGNWFVLSTSLTDATKYIRLNTTNGQLNAGVTVQASTNTTFLAPAGLDVTVSGSTYVAYLFATCAGVSKVGTYTGSDSDLNIDCGFTSGARFVMIKRTDASSDWYVWDSARGIVSGNDPRLSLNTTAAEVTDMNMINTYSAGFSVPAGGPNTGAGATFIYLAIA